MEMLGLVANSVGAWSYSMMLAAPVSRTVGRTRSEKEESYYAVV
jgi:hypothetical protein